MMDYQHVGVAATFSPTFTGVFAEAKRFASHCGADLEIVHAGAFDIEKETRFLEALGQRAAIRWVEGETAASVIITAVEDFAYDLLVAGTPHRHMDDKPFAGDVAPELLRNAPCDLLLVPRPLEDPSAAATYRICLRAGAEGGSVAAIRLWGRSQARSSGIQPE